MTRATRITPERAPRLPRLAELPRPVRLFLSGFLVTLSLGYGLGLVHVWEKTSLKVSGIQGRYGATESESHYPKSLGELLETTHNHTLTFALIFLSAGAIFLLSDAPPRLKTVLLVEPWIAIPASMGSMFGTRYVSEAFGYVLYGASMLTALTFGLMVGFSLRDLWLAREATA